MGDISLKVASSHSSLEELPLAWITTLQRGISHSLQLFEGRL